MASLGNIFSGNTGRGGGISPLTVALLGVLAYRTLKGKGRLAEMLGQGNAAPSSAKQQSGGLGAVLGGLGGLGGLTAMLGQQGAGNAISDGLNHLLERFQQNGQGDKAQSWVSSGPNKPISPPELEQGLGQERVEWLVQQTGLPKDELLAGLSRELPETVNQLTPEGRVPDPQEALQRITH